MSRRRIDHLRKEMWTFLSKEEEFRSLAKLRKTKIKNNVYNEFAEGRRESFGDIETIARKRSSEDPRFKELVADEQFAGRLATMYAVALQAEVAYEQTYRLRNADSSCVE